jgi:hypothetical protein
MLQNSCLTAGPRQCRLYGNGAYQSYGCSCIVLTLRYIYIGGGVLHVLPWRAHDGHGLESSHHNACRGLF